MEKIVIEIDDPTAKEFKKLSPEIKADLAKLLCFLNHYR